ASRYNEGKLHLGFVYAADRTFRTAERMILGAARFMDVLERWVPAGVLRSLPARPFDYVVHRDTMVGIAEVEAHFARVERALGDAHTLRRGIPFLEESRPIWRRLSADALRQSYAPDRVIAAYETCEIAIDTWVLADAL